MKNIKPVIVLFLICLVSAISLALVNKETSKKRSENQRKNIETAQKEILPAEIRNNIGAIILEREYKTENLKYYKVTDKNNTVLAYIAETTEKGYGGDVKMLVSINLENKIIGVKAVAHSETPGLGAKIEEISESMGKKMKVKNNLVDIKKPWFCEQFKGLSSDKLLLKKDDPNGVIDAITASTITSRAVTKAIKKGLEKNFNTEQFSNLQK